MTQPDRHTADTITSDALDQLYADLEAAKHFARTCAKDTEKALKRQRGAKLRADLAETELRTLRTGLRAIGADPTQIQNLWAQIHLRNRQWREEKQRAERAEVALARIREFAANIDTIHWRAPGTEVAARIRAALDEQQEQQPVVERDPVCNCTWGGLEIRRCPVHEPAT